MLIYKTISPGDRNLSLNGSALVQYAMSPEIPFREATPTERAFNRAYGFFVGLGIGAPSSYLVEVRGRKSGKIYSTPVSLLRFHDKQFLVAPRGRTQWVRNAEAAGEVALKRSWKRKRYKIRPLADSEKPEILKAYLDTYKGTVHRFFPVQVGSPVSVFVEWAPNYPAFELFEQ